MRAIRADDVAALTQLFTQDAVLRSDGGGKAIAAINPIVGPGRIARFVAGVVRKYRDALHSRAVTVNGEPGFIISIRGVLVQALALEIDAGHISAVYVMRNPDKLHAIAERYGLITEDQVG
jgi:RNA polymerase sigma-70 factor (ECF subfamily)